MVSLEGRGAGTMFFVEAKALDEQALVRSCTGCFTWSRPVLLGGDAEGRGDHAARCRSWL